MSKVIKCHNFNNIGFLKKRQMLEKNHLLSFYLFFDISTIFFFSKFITKSQTVKRINPKTLRWNFAKYRFFFNFNLILRTIVNFRFWTFAIFNPIFCELQKSLFSSSKRRLLATSRSHNFTNISKSEPFNFPWRKFHTSNS